MLARCVRIRASSTGHLPSYIHLLLGVLRVEEAGGQNWTGEVVEEQLRLEAAAAEIQLDLVEQASPTPQLQPARHTTGTFGRI